MHAYTRNELIDFLCLSSHEDDKIAYENKGMTVFLSGVSK